VSIDIRMSMKSRQQKLIATLLLEHMLAGEQANFASLVQRRTCFVGAYPHEKLSQKGLKRGPLP
jgi:hypothetical protein